MLEKLRLERRQKRPRLHGRTVAQEITTIVSQIVIETKEPEINDVSESETTTKHTQLPEALESHAYGMSGKAAARMAEAFPNKIRDKWERLKWLRSKA